MKRRKNRGPEDYCDFCTTLRPVFDLQNDNGIKTCPDCVAKGLSGGEIVYDDIEGHRGKE